tara:strand:- start:7766 stop:10552 length:2787 start_codon:yes stop_codon:yes gene_type:complete
MPSKKKKLKFKKGETLKRDEKGRLVAKNIEAIGDIELPDAKKPERKPLDKKMKSRRAKLITPKSKERTVRGVDESVIREDIKNLEEQEENRLIGGDEEEEEYGEKTEKEIEKEKKLGKKWGKRRGKDKKRGEKKLKKVLSNDKILNNQEKALERINKAEALINAGEQSTLSDDVSELRGLYEDGSLTFDDYKQLLKETSDENTPEKKEKRLFENIGLNSLVEKIASPFKRDDEKGASIRKLKKELFGGIGVDQQLTKDDVSKMTRREIARIAETDPERARKLAKEWLEEKNANKQYPAAAPAPERLTPEEYFPDLKRPIAVGTYSRKTLGSGNIYSAAGSVFPQGLEDARLRALQKQAAQKAKKLDNITTIPKTFEPYQNAYSQKFIEDIIMESKKYEGGIEEAMNDVDFLIKMAKFKDLGASMVEFKAYADKMTDFAKDNPYYTPTGKTLDLLEDYKSGRFVDRMDEWVDDPSKFNKLLEEVEATANLADLRDNFIDKAKTDQHFASKGWAESTIDELYNSASDLNALEDAITDLNEGNITAFMAMLKTIPLKRVDAWADSIMTSGQYKIPEGVDREDLIDMVLPFIGTELKVQSIKKAAAKASRRSTKHSETYNIYNNQEKLMGSANKPTPAFTQVKNLFDEARVEIDKGKSFSDTKNDMKPVVIEALNSNTNNDDFIERKGAVVAQMTSPKAKTYNTNLVGDPNVNGWTLDDGVNTSFQQYKENTEGMTVHSNVEQAFLDRVAGDTEVNIPVKITRQSVYSAYGYRDDDDKWHLLRFSDINDKDLMEQGIDGSKIKPVWLETGNAVFSHKEADSYQIVVKKKFDVDEDGNPTNDGTLAKQNYEVGKTISLGLSRAEAEEELKKYGEEFATIEDYQTTTSNESIPVSKIYLQTEDLDLETKGQANEAVENVAPNQIVIQGDGGVDF